MAGRPRSPAGLEANAGNGQVSLTWDTHPETDIVGFKIYRRVNWYPREEIDSIENVTSYFDNTVTNGIIYRYDITAIDTFGSESYQSDLCLAIPMAFDRGIVVVDETKGNVGKQIDNFVDGDSVNTFYQRVLSGYDWSYIDHSNIGRYDTLALTELSPYRVAIIHLEDLGSVYHLGHYQNNTFLVLDYYLKAGGKVVIEGRKNLMDTSGECDDGCLRDSSELQSFILNHLHIKQAFLPEWDPHDDTTQEFVGAFSQIADYPNLEVDSIRVEQCIDSFWIENYGLTLGGKVPGVGWFMPDNSAEVIYTFNSAYDTSECEGKPVGLRYLGEQYSVIYFDFPLYFIKENQATELLHQVLADLEEYTGVDDDEQKANIPSEFILTQNYPNPFNIETTIEYSLFRNACVHLNIYNILGQKVRTLIDKEQTIGHKKVIWDGKNDKGEVVSSGVYFYRIKAGDFIDSKKMLLLK